MSDEIRLLAFIAAVILLMWFLKGCGLDHVGEDFRKQDGWVLDCDDDDAGVRHCRWVEIVEV